MVLAVLRSHLFITWSYLSLVTQTIIELQAKRLLTGWKEAFTAVRERLEAANDKRWEFDRRVSAVMRVHMRGV